MAADKPVVVVSLGPVSGVLERALGDDVDARSLQGMSDAERLDTLARADVVLSWNWRREIRPEESAVVRARFVQLVSAGADHLPLDQMPPEAVVASNVGAYSEPMAEHALAMALAMRKQLPQRHAKMAAGVWDQSLTRWFKGTVCGILGFGGIGQATGRRMAALGGRVHAINTSGRTEEPVDFVGTLADLDTVLAASDVIVIALPLTVRTHGLIGKAQLETMKPDAVLVNMARGDIIDQGALYEHLRDHPEFSAAIDAWWTEPLTSGEFKVDYPFFELPNLLGSPHNSGLAPGVIEEAMERAVDNVHRFLSGQPVTGVVVREDYAKS